MSFEISHNLFKVPNLDKVKHSLRSLAKAVVENPHNLDKVSNLDKVNTIIGLSVKL